MTPVRASRDSVGEAITTDGVVGIRSPKPDATSPWQNHSRGHSRNISESYGLLQSPLNVHEYSTTTYTPNYRYDHPKREKRKIPPWAGIPQSLDKDRNEKLRDWAVDFSMVLLAVPFLALAGTIIRLDGHAVETGREALQQSILVTATIFPLLFSVVVGRAAIKLATWKLERGTTLGLLESLIGSRTVGGTILTQIRLWPLTFLGLGLILIWLMSPMGSQAALRMLVIENENVESSSNITYSNLRQSSYAGAALFPGSWFAGFASTFTGALLAPEAVKTGPLDVNGNIKIPLYSSLANLSEDEDGWRDIPENNFTPSYSSLFGIPVSGIPTGNSTLSIESTYLELTCSNMTSITARPSIPNKIPTFVDPGLITTNGPFRSSSNVSADTLWAMGYLGTDITPLLANPTSSNNTCLDCLRNNFTSQKLLPGTLLYQDFSGLTNATSIYCVPSQTYVESLISCSKSSTSHSCAVTSQRLSILPSQPSALTYLSFSSVFSAMTQLLPQTTQKISNVDIFQNYLINPLSNSYIQSTPIPRLSPTNNSNNESPLLNTNMQDFSTRLSQLINAFLHGSTANSTAYLTSSNSFSISLNAKVLTTPDDLTAAIKAAPETLTVPLIIRVSTPTYALSIPFLSLFLLSTLILLLAAIFSAYLHHHNLTRDYLPYVSSLIRESQFVSMPRGGVKMGGMQRTREMRDLKVRLGDVGDVGAGWEVGTGVAVSVGQMAVGDWAGEKGKGKGRGGVRKGKLYL